MHIIFLLRQCMPIIFDTSVIFSNSTVSPRYFGEKILTPGEKIM